MDKLINKTFKILKLKKIRISVAESCTGGMLSSVLTSKSGSSKIFDLGLITYSNKSKNILLKVPNNVIKKYGAVSKEVCSAMVKNLNKVSKSHISISITGIAGPNGGTKEKPVGLVYIGILINNRIAVEKHLFKNKNRLQIQRSTVKKALELILRCFK